MYVYLGTSPGNPNLPRQQHSYQQSSPGESLDRRRIVGTATTEPLRCRNLSFHLIGFQGARVGTCELRLSHVPMSSADKYSTEKYGTARRQRRSSVAY